MIIIYDIKIDNNTIMVVRFIMFGAFRNIDFQTSLKINSKALWLLCNHLPVNYTKLGTVYITMYITQLQRSQTLHQTDNLRGLIPAQKVI